MTLEALRDGDPRQVGPYALLGRLGEGGMGVVYLGQGADGGRVAVKVISARVNSDAGFRRRFAREVAAAKRVARFCTAPVLDADVEGEVAYLVTEYVEGPNLGDVVRESGPLKGSALDGLAASMAMALRAIHGAGVVHRDLKPSNVLLSQVGPKVIDFGIAQLADAEVSSAIVGTPAYMSPEQVSGSPIGPASDIFSWGGTVAFAASGRPPFGSGSVPTILLGIVNDAPSLEGLPGPLRDLVAASLAKNPARRPTAQELMDHLSTSASLPGAAPATPRTPGARAGSSGGTGASAGAAEAGAPGAARSGATAPGPGAPGLPPGAEAGRTERGAEGRRRMLAAAAAVVVALAGVAAALTWRGSPGDDRTARTGNGGTTETAGSPQGEKPSTAQATSVPAQARNPLRAQDNVPFYSPAEPGAAGQAVLWEDDRPEDADLMRKLAAVPHAIRLTEPEIGAKLDDALAGAARSGGVPVFLVNVMPGSDCRPTGAADMAAYQAWIKGIADRINDDRAVIILEPGSLVKIPGTRDCDLQGSPEQRYKDLRQAVQTLKTNPGTAVYLDGSQDYWPGTEIMAERLVGAGVDRADGFFTNVNAFQSTDKSVAYGKRLSACIAVRLATGRTGCPADVPADPAKMPHFVVDTSRNGRGSWTPPPGRYTDPQTWCNPPGRGVGDRPTTATGEELVDAYVWVTRAGTSNGRCRRGTSGGKDPERGAASPPAGEWWGDLALERAELANPPLR